MDPRRYARRSLALSLACLLAAGCSDSTEGATGGGIDAGATAVDTGPGWTPASRLTVETGVSDDGPEAGEEIIVVCTVEGLLAGQPRPATHWEIVAQPDPLPHPPEAADDALVLKTAGEYRVRCVLDETNWSDPTPVRVTVGPTDAVSVETTVSPSTLGAGATGDVMCEGTDPYGNVISDDWFIDIAPGGPAPGQEDGLISSAFKLKALVVGSYEVACRQKNGTVDDTPAVVTVEHGLPNRIVTTLAEEQIVAGTATKVTCTAEDKQGNVVPDLPMTLDLPDGVSLTGLNVGATITGSYVVKCVPAALDWDLFQLQSAILQVLPDAPVTLEIKAQPPKPFFATFEVVTVVVVAHDQFGNPVPDAALEPIEVSPNENFASPSPLTFRFKVEGYFTLTGRLLNDPSVSSSLEIAVNGAPPAVVVEWPPRGATLTSTKPSVTVAGLAQDEIAGIVAVRVNGQDAFLKEDGSFTRIIIPKWGLNILFVEAEDGGGNITSLMQTFYFSDRWHPLEPDVPFIGDALKLWLSEDFIDDGVHNPTHPDDMATILEAVFKDFDLGSMLGAEMEIGAGYSVALSNINFNPPKLNLDPTYGGLDLTIDIKNLTIKVKLKGECKVLGVDLCPDFSGSIAVDRIVMDAFLKAVGIEGNLDVQILNPNVNLEHVDVDIDGILGWLFDWIIDFVVNIFTGTIEDLLEDQISDLLGDTLSDLLAELAISETFVIDALLPGMQPTSLTFDSTIWTVDFTPEGGRLGLAARFLAAKKVTQEVLGSIGRGTCLKGWPVNWQLPGAQEFELAVYDDFLNQALAVVWQNGLLNLAIDDTTLAGGGDGGFDLGGLPFDGINVTTNFLLPPILNGCTTDGFVRLQIGDMFLDAALESVLFEGGVGKLGAYLAIEMRAEIYLAETDLGEPALGLILHEIETLEFHWEYVPSIFEGSEDELEQLIVDLLIDKLLADYTGQPLFEFPIPEIDISGLLNTGGGSPVVIVPLIEQMSREGGHTLVQGELE